METDTKTKRNSFHIAESIFSDDRLKTNLPVNTILSQYNDPKELCRFLFRNFHEKSGKGDGYRLTNEGLGFLRLIYKSYTIDVVDGFKFTPNILLKLHRNINSPWHYDNLKFTFFDEEFAVQLELLGGDLEKFFEIISD